MGQVGTTSPIRFALANDDTEKRKVGIPIQELILTRALQEKASLVYPPGAGRSLYVIPEADLGAGRPDIILLTVSSNGLQAYAQRRLRIGSAAAAKVLDPGVSSEETGVTAGTARSITRSLQLDGWRKRDFVHASHLIHDSLAVEAKVKDWKQAARQVSKFRRYFHQSAVLMPERSVTQQLQRTLHAYGCGLIQHQAPNLRWVEHPVPSPPPPWARVWLLELLLRGLDDGSAYRLTDPRNADSESR